MNCTIIWKQLNISEWEQYFNLVSRSNLLQYYAYGQAIQILGQREGKNFRLALIEINGKNAGILQVIEAGAFKNALHAVMVDRGPLWFEGYGSPEHFRAFAQALNREFPRRLGRKRRFLPETQDGTLLIDSGFKPVNQNAYQTAWMDLRLDETTLLGNLNKKWRNSLRKAEKSDLTLEWDDKGEFLPWILKVYQEDKAVLDYEGPSVELLIAMAQTFIPEKNMMIGRALIDNKPVAAILVLVHGSGATYQIGWSSPDGRKNSAHHFLLWNVLKLLKNRNVKDFDLGGVNDQSAKGVKKFKENMGGELVRLAGMYS